MSSGSDEVVTTLLISNLHCSRCVNVSRPQENFPAHSTRSCVRTIENVLETLTPRPTSVDVSVVTQAVTVRHSQALFPDIIKEAIAAEGFDIVSTPTGPQPSHPTGLSRINPLAPASRAVREDLRHIESNK